MHPPPPSSGRPPRLVLRFAVLAGLALAVAGAAGLAVSRAVAAERAEQGVWTSARFLADDLGRDDLARQALEAPATGDLRAQLDELFGRAAVGPDVVAVTLYDREGRVTFSTDHALIGRTGLDGGKVQAALAGDGVRGTGVRHGRKVLESYVPVRWLLSDASFPTGVLRVTTDYAPVAQEIADDARAQAAVLLLALVLLYVSLFPILRRVTNRLARSEASYRALTEQASDAILVADAAGTILEANEQAYRLLGASRLVGRAFSDLVDPEELRRDPLQIDEVVAGLTLLRERTFRREDGTALVGELHARQLDDGRLLIAIRDATARKEAERVRSRLAAIVESSHDGIVGLDLSGRIVSWNVGAERIYGWTAAEAVGRDVALLTPPDAAEAVRPGSTIEEFERVHVRRDGEPIDVALTVSPIRDGAGAVVGASLIARDVTEDKRRELELRRAQRAEGTARLAAGVAHDFSGLLTEIAGNADLMLARLPDRDGLRPRAERIQEAAMRGTELTRQLGAFGGRRDVAPRVLDVASLLRRLEPELRRLVHDRVRILLDVEPELGRVEVDPRGFEQVLVGLVLNAETAMADGGTIRIAAANVDFSRRRRTPGPDARVEPGSYVMLGVTDDGVGPGEARLGLELAAVFGLVQRGGGTIGIESEPGRGTTVRVYLPRVEAPVARIETPAVAPAARSGGGGETILVVEDEVVVRALVREILEEQGYRVLEANGGRDALALADEGRGFDLVLTDVVMPELGGLELAQELARLRPGCPVIAMSGSPGEERDGLAFLQKPFTHETLTRAVRAALDRLEPALV